MKKFFSLVLCMLMALPPLSGLAGTPGEAAEASFRMLTNPGNAYMIKITLEYNPEVLELVPNGIFDRDVCLVKFDEDLTASFRIRENVRPGSYPVGVHVIEAVDKKGDPVQFPTYSGSAVAVESLSVEVPVYYYDAAIGALVKTETVELPAGWTGMVTGNAPEGYIVTSGQSMQVTVTKDGRAVPSSVTFWVAAPTPTPSLFPKDDLLLEYDSDNQNAQAEVLRMRNAYNSGTPLEELFNTQVAVEIAGARDILDVIPVTCRDEATNETYIFQIWGSAHYQGVICVIGIYEADLSLYSYETLPTECRPDGSAIITVTQAQLEAVKAAKSTILVFIQM